jgi:hypothetical protein
MRNENLYSVAVVRIGYSTRVITVSATSKKQAKMQAEYIAGDFEFIEHSSDYIANEVYLKETKNA